MQSQQANHIPKHTLLRFKQKASNYCLCIPVINEGERIKKQLRELKALSMLVDIIICDGGSTDGSLSPQFLQKQNVSLLLTKQDRGKLSSQLRMGYAYALLLGYEGIVTMDGNGKDDPSAIPVFIERLQAGCDYIQGSRFLAGGKHRNTPLARLIANRYFHAPLLSLAAGHYWFNDTTNGFRAYSRRYLMDRRVAPFRKIFDTYELLAYLTVRANQLGYIVCQIPVSRIYPKGKVATKIVGFRANLKLLAILMKTCLRQYHPKTKA